MKKYLTKTYVIPAVTAILVAAAVIIALVDRVGQVRVNIPTGYGYVSEGDIREVIDICEGDRMVSLCARYRSLLLLRDTNDIERRIMNSNHFVESAGCRFEGNDLYITVTEAKPVFYILFGDSYLLCGADAKVLACQDSAEGGFPVYQGEVESFTLGQKVSLDEGKLRTIIRICEIFEAADADRSIRGRLLGFSIRSLGDIILFTEGDITVNLGRIEDLQDNMFTLHKILSDYLNQDQRGYLDFTLGDSPVFKPYK